MEKTLEHKKKKKNDKFPYRKNKSHIFKLTSNKMVVELSEPGFHDIKKQLNFFISFYNEGRSLKNNQEVNRSTTKSLWK